MSKHSMGETGFMGAKGLLLKKTHIFILAVLLIFVGASANLQRMGTKPVRADYVPAFVHNNRSLFLSGPLIEAKAAGYLYSGNYRGVKQLLMGQALSKQGIILVSRAQLALGEYPAALTYSRLGGGIWEAIKGLQLAKLGYLQGAEQLLTVAIPQLSPDTGWLEFALSQIVARQGRRAEAEQLVQKLQKKEPGYPALWVAQGDSALERGDYSGAQQAYDRAAAQGYLKADPLFIARRGIASIGLGSDVKGVITELEAVDTAGGLPDYLLALAMLQKGNFQGARQNLALALAKKMPAQMEPAAEKLLAELDKRISAEPQIQAVIAKGGH